PHHLLDYDEEEDPEMDIEEEEPEEEPAKEADAELKVEEAGVEPEARGLMLRKVVERLKVLESEENATLRKKLA
nr:hypothetical protein [Tanacetum cinerariifolium]